MRTDTLECNGERARVRTSQADDSPVNACSASRELVMVVDVPGLARHSKSCSGITAGTSKRAKGELVDGKE